ncbi:hypothetical protein H2203_001723 [Taxawa tesnikishii (nom. ined.)]|nr:hypothetical protein H2203_001723 [Dothideales sp. JES 119]
MRFLSLLPAVLPLAHCLPASPTTSPLPLVIWHGLGDRYDADGLNEVSKLAQRVHPGTHTYIVRLDDDGQADQKATFFGNLTEQIASVCDTLSADPKLSANNTRIDALGFSQGGQFLRGLIERCPGISVRSLVTFGSQHNGIAKFQACGTWDFLCKGAVGLIRGNAWSEWVQGNIVPAQYYRELNETSGLGSKPYLEASNFIADVNNERANKSSVYKKRLSMLEKFVMYVFDEDKTVIPKESGWFAEVNGTSEEVIPLRNRTIYHEDWIGLKELDRKGALVFKTAPGEHMRLSDKLLKETFKEFYGPETKANEWRIVDEGEEQEVFNLHEL